MKAYTYENEHDYLAIAYVETDAELDRLDDPKRAAWADAYYPNEPPASAWLDAGYSHGCHHCEHVLSASDGECERCVENAAELCPDGEGDYYGGSIVFDERGNVYCSAQCMEDLQAEHAMRKERKAQVSAECLARFPFAVITEAWIGGPGQCQCFRKDNYNACVHFTFTGAKMGDSANTFCGGCKQAWIARGDLEACSMRQERRHS